MSTKGQDWTVKSMLEWATDYFKSNNIPNPRHSIEWLLAQTLDIKRLDLYLCFDRPLSPTELDQLRPLVKRRAAHEPLQYITGYSDFMNARIDVTPAVLIPRIETEQLVEIILDRHPTEQNLSVLDIGTGSGCIPVALKMERPQWKVSAFDISEPALNVARQNAEANGVDVSFVKGDINQAQQLPFSNHWDVIVSNPPYITLSEKASLQPQVKEHEPEEALFCDDIRKMYSQIIEYAARNLNSGGMLYLEINEQHGPLILDLFEQNMGQPRLLKDYQDKNRFVITKKP